MSTAQQHACLLRPNIATPISLLYKVEASRAIIRFAEGPGSWGAWPANSAARTLIPAEIYWHFHAGDSRKTIPMTERGGTCVQGRALPITVYSKLGDAPGFANRTVHAGTQAKPWAPRDVRGCKSFLATQAQSIGLVSGSLPRGGVRGQQHWPGELLIAQQLA